MKCNKLYNIKKNLKCYYVGSASNLKDMIMLVREFTYMILKKFTDKVCNHTQ